MLWTSRGKIFPTPSIEDRLPYTENYSLVDNIQMIPRLTRFIFTECILIEYHENNMCKICQKIMSTI